MVKYEVGQYLFSNKLEITNYFRRWLNRHAVNDIAVGTCHDLLKNLFKEWHPRYEKKYINLIQFKLCVSIWGEKYFKYYWFDNKDIDGNPINFRWIIFSYRKWIHRQGINKFNHEPYDSDDDSSGDDII